MLKLATAVAQKDLLTMLASAGNLIQAVLLGLLLIFIFSLSLAPGELATPQEGATIFWLGSAFCQILIFNQLYALEEANSSRLGLLLIDAPPQAIWLGKSCAGFCLLLFSQLFFLPGIVIFLAQDFSGEAIGWAALPLVDAGMAVAGGLLGSLAHGQSGRDTLLAVLVFPLLLPLLLAGIGLLGAALGAPESGLLKNWLGIGVAFDAIFAAAGLGLFGFIYQGDE
ncbi:MAG: heme ABC transporter permease CcmB [Desulfovibrio sp.]|nr:heme ABC transporter permease CcmB [Desulfovibrio sp.]